MFGLTIIWHILFTSAIDWYDGHSGVVDSNHCNRPVDPRVVEREPWFLSHNWHKWPNTWGVPPVLADFHLFHRKIHLRKILSLVCERLDTLDNDWGHWLILGLHKIPVHLL